MAELAHNGVLEGQEFAQTIRKLGIETMYIPKRRALKIKCEITADQSNKQTMLLDSGATDNFIDYCTAKRLGLRKHKMPQSQRVLNVDGTENQAGEITHYVALYIQHNNRQEGSIFFITNLGKDHMILGYPWLEQFNPDIDWENGRILGTPITMKTPAAVTKE